MPADRTQFTVIIDREGYDHPADKAFMQELSGIYQVQQ